MNAQDLKNSILQLAIQGKLVEQREEEGTAKELIEEIKTDKERLIKEKKIKKEKPLAEITEDEVPFEIPESWEWVRLGDVIDIVRGASPRPIKAFITESEYGINWIKIGDTEKGSKYINKTNEKITVEGMKKSRYVEKGDFLLSNSMSFGRPYILNIDGCIHDGWLALSQLIEIFDKDFLYHLLSSSMVYYQFCGRVSGAVVNNLNSDKVKLTVIPLPPLTEQKRIVAKIEELMPYIEKYGEAHSKLEVFNKKFPEDMQKSILQYAIQGKLVEQREEEGTAEELYKGIQEEKEKLIKEGKIKREKPLAEITDDEIPFEIPKSWKWVRLNNILNFIDYRGKTPNKIDNGVILITASNVRKGFLDFKKEDFISESEFYERMSRGITQKGDILFTTEAPLGNVAINTIEVASCGQRVITFQQYGKWQFYNELICLFIQSPLFQQELLNNATGTTAKGIKAAKLKNILLPLPPLAEQKRIVAKIEEMLPYCKQLVK